MNVTNAMRKASFSPARKRMSLAFLIFDLLYIILGFSCYYYRSLPAIFKNLLPHLWLVLMALALIVACIAIFAVSEYDVLRGCLAETVILAVEGVWFGAAATHSTMLTPSPDPVVQLFFMIGFGCFLVLNLAFHIDLIWYRPIMRFLTEGRAKPAEAVAPTPRVYPPSDVKHRRAARKAYHAQNRIRQQQPTAVTPKADPAPPQPKIQVVKQPSAPADHTRVLPDLSAKTVPPTRQKAVARKPAPPQPPKPAEPPRRAHASKAKPHAPAKTARPLPKKPEKPTKRPSAQSSVIADNAGLFIRSKERVYRHVDREK